MIKAILKDSGEILTEFKSWADAQKWKSRLSTNVSSLYELRTTMSNGRVIVEGLSIGDLTDILVPQVSIDEYEAKNGNDNIVVAFFVHNVPEAIEPLRRICDRCPGVVDTDSGDSDTLRNTSIIYCEFKRKDVKVQHISKMVELVARIAELKASEMSISFPNTDKLYPFSEEVVTAYFSKILVPQEKKKQQQKAEIHRTKLDEDVRTLVNSGLKFWYNEHTNDAKIFGEGGKGNQHHYQEIVTDPGFFGLTSLPEPDDNMSREDYTAYVIWQMLDVGWVRGTVRLNEDMTCEISLESSRPRHAYEAVKWAIKSSDLCKKISKILVEVRKGPSTANSKNLTFKTMADFRRYLTKD